MTTGARRNVREDTLYRRMAARARDSATHCYLCGRPIDHGLPHDHPGAATADHLTPVSTGGPIHGPMYGAHRVCNMRRYNKPITDALRARLATLPLAWDPTPTTQRTGQPRHSQQW